MGSSAGMKEVYGCLPSGNLTELLNIVIEIVDLSLWRHGDFLYINLLYSLPGASKEMASRCLFSGREPLNVMKVGELYLIGCHVMAKKDAAMINHPHLSQR